MDIPHLTARSSQCPAQTLFAIAAIARHYRPFTAVHGYSQLLSAIVSYCRLLFRRCGVQLPIHHTRPRHSHARIHKTALSPPTLSTTAHGRRMGGGARGEHRQRTGHRTRTAHGRRTGQRTGGALGEHGTAHGKRTDGARDWARDGTEHGQRSRQRTDRAWMTHSAQTAHGTVSVLSANECS